MVVFAQCWVLCSEFYVRVVILASPQPPEEGRMPASHLRYQTSQKLPPDFQKVVTFIHRRVSPSTCALDECDPSSYCYHFTDEKAETWRVEDVCSRLHSWPDVLLGFGMSLSDLQARTSPGPGLQSRQGSHPHPGKR